MSTEPEKIDLSRLDALVKLKGEEEALRALLQKATARRDAELSVYARVSADYLARIAAIADQAQAERARARDTLATLDQLHETGREALERARAQMQECEFRHQIGEFTPEQFASCRQAAQKAVVECEAEFQRIGDLRQGYIDLLSDAPVSRAAVNASRNPAPATPVAVISDADAATAASPPHVPVAAPLPSAPQASTPPDTAPVPLDATMFLALPGPAPPPPSPPEADDAIPAALNFGTVVIASAMLTEQQGGQPFAEHRIGLLTTIGRTADNQIVVPLKDVSRRHAEVTRMPNGYVLKDLNSPNGTFVNGERIREHLLQDGDMVTIGGTTFVFQKP